SPPPPGQRRRSLGARVPRPDRRRPTPDVSVPDRKRLAPAVHAQQPRAGPTARHVCGGRVVGWRSPATAPPGEPAVRPPPATAPDRARWAPRPRPHAPALRPPAGPPPRRPHWRPSAPHATPAAATPE